MQRAPDAEDRTFARTRALCKRFGKAPRPALAGVDLHVEAGILTGLVGPDGAGKTTLLRLLAGLLAPTSGSAVVFGRDPATETHALRHLVGYMPQKFGLYEDLTVLENLQLYADLKGVVGVEREETFSRLLSFTDLARFGERLAGQLSGG